jgi:hypothetical protein
MERRQSVALEAVLSLLSARASRPMASRAPRFLAGVLASGWLSLRLPNSSPNRGTGRMTTEPSRRTSKATRCCGTKFHALPHLDRDGDLKSVGGCRSCYQPLLPQSFALFSSLGSGQWGRLATFKNRPNSRGPDEGWRWRGSTGRNANPTLPAGTASPFQGSYRGGRTRPRAALRSAPGYRRTPRLGLGGDEEG